MQSFIDGAENKVVKLSNELVDLKKKYASATKSSDVSLKSLKILTRKSTEAAVFSGKAAAKSLIAVRKVAKVMGSSRQLKLLVYVSDAEIAAEMAAKSAAVSTKMLQEVLLKAKTVNEGEKDVAAIRVSIISVMIAMRSAEAATAAAKLAQSVTAFASAIPLAVR